jgi:hypothetical protein
MKRTAARGEGKFTNVSWDEAIAAAATTLAKVRSANPDGIVFFDRTRRGHAVCGRRTVRAGPERARARDLLASGFPGRAEGSGNRFRLARSPGSEPQFLEAVGRILRDSGLARRRHQLSDWIVEGFRNANAGSLLAGCGPEEKRVRPLIGMLRLRYVFLQEPARGWLADGTLDWLWAAAEHAGVRFSAARYSFCSRSSWLTNPVT